MPPSSPPRSLVLPHLLRRVMYAAAQQKLLVRYAARPIFEALLGQTLALP
ncbi:MAG: hypothetical protein ACYC4S_04395 [Rhodoferax sp.]